jgi:hypothetical protein
MIIQTSVLRKRPGEAIVPRETCRGMGSTWNDAIVYFTKVRQDSDRQAGKPSYLERLRGFFFGVGLCAGGVDRNRRAMSSIVTGGGSGKVLGCLRAGII